MSRDADRSEPAAARPSDMDIEKLLRVALSLEAEATHTERRHPDTRRRDSGHDEAGHEEAGREGAACAAEGPVEEFEEEAALSSEELLAFHAGGATPVERTRVSLAVAGPPLERIGTRVEDRLPEPPPAVPETSGSPAGSPDGPGSRPGVHWFPVAARVAAAVVMAALAILGTLHDPETVAIAALVRGDFAAADAWLVARVGEPAGSDRSLDRSLGRSEEGVSRGGPVGSAPSLWTTGSSPLRLAEPVLSPLRILTPRSRSLSARPTIRVARRDMAEGIALTAIVEDLAGRVWLQVELKDGVAVWPTSEAALPAGASFRVTVAGPTPLSPRVRAVFEVASADAAARMDAARGALAARVADPTLRSFGWAGALARAGFHGDALEVLASLAFGVGERAWNSDEARRARDSLIAFLRSRAATRLAGDLSAWDSRIAPR